MPEYNRAEKYDTQNIVVHVDHEIVEFLSTSSRRFLHFLWSVVPLVIVVLVFYFWKVTKTAS